MAKAEIVESWEVHIKKGTYHGKTKEEVLARSKKRIDEQEQEGLSWELHHVFTTERTKPFPKVLILDRQNNPGAWIENIHLADSSGNRSVWFYSLTGDYDDAQDLPLELFKKVEWHCSNLKKNGHDVSICMLREDPGLGIFIPEIDRPNIEEGKLADGCIPISKEEN